MPTDAALAANDFSSPEADLTARGMPGVLHPSSLSTKLVAGFIATAATAVLVGIVGLYFIDNINTTLNNISDVAAPTVETSDDLIANIFEATKVAEEIIADEELSDIELLVVEVKSLNSEFETTYEELQTLVSDVSLLDELETARQEQKRFTVHVDRMIAAHTLELEKEALGFKLLKTFDEVGTDLTLALDEFAEKNEAQMAKAEARGDDLAQQGAPSAEINRVLGELFDRDYPVVEASLKMQRLIMEMQDTAGEYLAEENPKNLKEIEGRFVALNESVAPHLAVLRNLTESVEDDENVRNLERKLQVWTALAFGEDQLFETHKETLRAELDADILTEEFEKDADKVVAALDKVAETADAISDGADEAAEGAVEQAQTTIAILLILALTGSMALLSLIVLTVVRPIRQLTSQMLNFTEHMGKDTSKASIAGNEVNQLRSAFDHLIFQVRQRTEELDSANKDLAEELNRRRSLEQQLVHAQKLDGLGTLAGGIAHDFNNMLYVILGCTKIVLSDLKGKSEIRDLILKIDEAAERSKSIVKQILFFSRQETPDKQPIDIVDAFDKSIMLLRAGLPSSIMLQVDIPKERWMTLADETQIQQVVMNLVTNASQSYDQGKGYVYVTMRPVDVGPELVAKHLGLQKGQYVSFTVKDLGCGIPDHILSRIYDPFFTTKPVGEGTGLGLAVVHGIITAHDGIITVSSEPGVGTEFSVYLPAWEGSQEPRFQIEANVLP